VSECAIRLVFLVLCGVGGNALLDDCDIDYIELLLWHRNIASPATVLENCMEPSDRMTFTFADKSTGGCRPDKQPTFSLYKALYALLTWPSDGQRALLPNQLQVVLDVLVNNRLRYIVIFIILVFFFVLCIVQCDKIFLSLSV
jgi:hypothetical protein